MDDPVKQIEGVIRSLTQGSPNEQSAALNRYYVPNAEFIHPFCRVPPFSNVSLPLIGEVQSRQLVLAIYRWYRIISPRIDLEVNSVQFDDARQKLYVDISQRFSLWFVPFMVANVNLVCRLSLVKFEAESPSQKDSYRQIANGEKQPDHGHALLEPIQNGELPSFAEVAQSEQPLSDDTSDVEVRYYVAKQEDLYQVNEWIKFIVPFGIGDAIISAGQLFATYLSLLGSIVFFPLVWILTHGGDSGNVMPPVKRVEDDGQVVWRGSGADWARRTFSPLNSIGASAVQGIVVNVQENAQTLAHKGEKFASNVHQRSKMLIHDVVAREEQMVKAAQEKAGGLADGVQQRAEGFAEVVQEKGAEYLDAAHQKTVEFIDAAQRQEERFVKGAQAREEHFVGDLKKKEEQAADNTRQWWAANKTG
ncbi:hypothetical protein GE09DRAFT_1291928 [Coniochaeta sp. 2T2.1]|nr:hypothetical protein GE09DRAFT_1291928 [Coniochaeta sp. 2T2.1]